MGLFPKLSFFFLFEPQLSGDSGRSGISREEATVMCVWVCSYFPSPVTASAKTLGLRPWACPQGPLREVSWSVVAEELDKH